MIPLFIYTALLPRALPLPSTITNEAACFRLGLPLNETFAPPVCDLTLLRMLFWQLGTRLLLHWPLPPPGGGGGGYP